MAVVPGYSATP